MRRADVSRLRVQGQWIACYVDTANGEDAMLHKHPARERAVARLLDGDPLTPAETAYLVGAGFAA